MIGIVGSADSVERLRRVAVDLEMADLLILRSYETLEDSARLALELDSMCNVLLFTGLVPFELARKQALGLRSRLQYIPHGGIDLYRTIALMLAERKGLLPRMSLDTIPVDITLEDFTDLGFEPPRHILSMPTGEGARIRSAQDVAAFHADCYRRGEVELCLTCLGSVAQQLTALGIPAIRVEHTRSSLRDGLMRAALTDRVVRVEETQIAVAALDAGDHATRRARSTANTLAARLSGSSTSAEDGLFLVHTTRGAVERWLAGHQWHQRELANDLEAPTSTRFGFGVGATAADAESNARRALQLYQGGDATYVVLPDGRILDGSGPAEAGKGLGSLRQTDERVLVHAREIGLTSITLSRLAASLRRLDVSAFTAQELGDAYGVETRSARRLLTTLIEAGVAQVAGSQGAPRAGRPQVVYRIDVSRLLPAD